MQMFKFVLSPPPPKLVSRLLNAEVKLPVTCWLYLMMELLEN